jgi:N-acetylglutamate synthase/N-acetylornithine aminotransferase
MVSNQDSGLIDCAITVLSCCNMTSITAPSYRMLKILNQIDNYTHSSSSIDLGLSTADLGFVCSTLAQNGNVPVCKEGIRIQRTTQIAC